MFHRKHFMTYKVWMHSKDQISDNIRFKMTNKIHHHLSIIYLFSSLIDSSLSDRGCVLTEWMLTAGKCSNMSKKPFQIRIVYQRFFWFLFWWWSYAIQQTELLFLYRHSPTKYLRRIMPLHVYYAGLMKKYNKDKIYDTHKLFNRII